MLSDGTTVGALYEASDFAGGLTIVGAFLEPERCDIALRCEWTDATDPVGGARDGGTTDIFK